MKYGVVTYARTSKINIGDSVMSLGIREIYKKMGIKDSDIVNVYYNKNVERDYQYDLEDCDGEYVLLPLTMSIDFDSEHPDVFPLHPRIIPVFMGFHAITPEGWVKHFHDYKQFGPFACRDVKTMELLRKEGLEAYTIGCLSIQCVERRIPTPNQNKVYLVDIPPKLKQYIPKDILEGSIEKTHIYEFDKSLTGAQAAKEDLRLTREILEEYRDNARLVVTSRLHCALPCISMGIPTIVVRRERARECVRVFDNRFKGLDVLMNSYNYDEFDKIDWNPEQPNIELLKEKQFLQASRMIRETYEKYNHLCDISYFFEQGKNQSYYSGVCLGYLSSKQKEDYLNRKTPYDNLLEVIMNRHLCDTHVIIYGAGDKGRWMWHKFAKEMRMAKSCVYVDGDVRKHNSLLNGYKVLSPEIIGRYKPHQFVIIIATSHTYDGVAQSIEKLLIEKYNLIEGRDYFMLDQLIKSGEKYISEISMVRDWLDDSIWN